MKGEVIFYVMDTMQDNGHSICHQDLRNISPRKRSYDAMIEATEKMVNKKPEFIKNLKLLSVNDMRKFKIPDFF